MNQKCTLYIYFIHHLIYKTTHSLIPEYHFHMIRILHSWFATFAKWKVQNFTKVATILLRSLGHLAYQIFVNRVVAKEFIIQWCVDERFKPLESWPTILLPSLSFTFGFCQYEWSSGLLILRWMLISFLIHSLSSFPKPHTLSTLSLSSGFAVERTKTIFFRVLSSNIGDIAPHKELQPQGASTTTPKLKRSG